MCPGKCISLPEPWGKAEYVVRLCVCAHILIEHSTACFARLRYPGCVPAWIMAFGIHSSYGRRQGRDQSSSLQPKAPTMRQPTAGKFPGGISNSLHNFSSMNHLHITGDRTWETLSEELRLHFLGEPRSPPRMQAVVSSHVIHLRSMSHSFLAAGDGMAR